MERCDACKCSPCRCEKKCCIALAPLGVLAIAIVILLGNLGIITAQLTSILWPILLGITAILKIIDCCCMMKKFAHCLHGRCDRCEREKDINPRV